jgi:hypothetical protein
MMFCAGLRKKERRIAMARFEESQDLFGRGTGDSTNGELYCEFCGKTYNEGADDETDGREPDDHYDEFDSIGYTSFAGHQVCENCFEIIESEVLRRMPDILKWYKRVLSSQKADIKNGETMLNDLLEGQ